MAVPLRELAHHRATECSSRSLTCKYCGGKVQQSTLEEHMAENAALHASILMKQADLLADAVERCGCAALALVLARIRLADEECGCRARRKEVQVAEAQAATASVRQELAAQWDTNDRLLKLLQQQESELKEQRETVKRLEGLLSHMTQLYQREVEESKAMRSRLRKQFQDHSKERLHLRAQSWQALNSISATAEMVLAQQTTTTTGAGASSSSTGMPAMPPSGSVSGSLGGPRTPATPATPTVAIAIPGSGSDGDRAAALFGHSLPYVTNLLSQLGQSPQLDERLSRSMTVHAPRST
jgi:hypothetical protein